MRIAHYRERDQVTQRLHIIKQSSQAHIIQMLNSTDETMGLRRQGRSASRSTAVSLSSLRAPAPLFSLTRSIRSGLRNGYFDKWLGVQSQKYKVFSFSCFCHETTSIRCEAQIVRNSEGQEFAFLICAPCCRRISECRAPAPIGGLACNSLATLVRTEEEDLCVQRSAIVPAMGAFSKQCANAV